MLFLTADERLFLVCFCYKNQNTTFDQVNKDNEEVGFPPIEETRTCCCDLYFVQFVTTSGKAQRFCPLLSLVPPDSLDLSVGESDSWALSDIFVSIAIVTVCCGAE